jgi:hypothetical protein
MKKLLNCFMLLLLAASGCTTKSGARAQSRAAYNAGRAAAYQQVLEEQRTSIRVIGNVRNPEIPWADGMTLMQALVQADCIDSRNPGEIILIRHHQPTPVDVKALLKGEDMPLEPGDTIEIHP